MKFLDVKTDYAFKKVFGSKDSVPILISFLNAILDYQGDAKITDLSIVDPYQIPLLKGMKDTFVDVKATLGNGKQIIIEMQVLNVKGFEKRILYNAAKQYSQQLKRGENYELINPVIALTFTDFRMFDGSEDYISQFRLLERKRYIEYTDDVELIFVELPKFNKNLEALENIKEKWVYFLKNAGDLDYIPDTLKDPCISQAFDTINEAALSREELELQEKRYDFIRLQKGALALAREQGLEQGIEQGILQTAQNMLNAGMSKKEIMKLTGLNSQQLDKL
jgi:predicted transposase/invertase (TIGR01784 family)